VEPEISICDSEKAGAKFCKTGGAGEELWVILELKLLADVD